MSRFPVCFAFALLFFFASCVAFFAHVSLAWGRDVYRLWVDPAGIEVSAKLFDLNAGHRVCLPAFGQRRGESFSGLFVEGGALDFDASGCADVAHALAALEIRYRLELRALDATEFWSASSLSPNASSQGLAFPGESLFIERSPSPEPVRIEVVTREGVVASLPQVAREQGGEGLWRVTLEAANGFALNRSYFLFGGAAPMVATLGQSGVTLMVTPEFEQQKSVLMRETLAVLAHYAEWMPAKLPPQMSVFVFYAPHDADHVEGFARPGGIVLQFGRAGMGHAQRRRVLVAHELFHLFNGEQLHFSKADYESAAWFREGLTQYMAILALRELGLLSPRQFLDIVSVAASTLLTQPDAHRTAESRSTMPYHRGFFLSWAIDSQWQSAKTGRSWAGFWRALSAQSWSEAFDNAKLREVLEGYSQFSFTGFFDMYVARQEATPVEAILQHQGLCLSQGLSLTYSAGLEFSLNARSATLLVTRVNAQMPAQQAGLTVGDRIVPVPDTRWRSQDSIHLQRVRGGHVQWLKLPTQMLTTPSLFVEPCAQSTVGSK